MTNREDDLTPPVEGPSDDRLDDVLGFLGGRALSLSSLAESEASVLGRFSLMADVPVADVVSSTANVTLLLALENQELDMVTYHLRVWS